ncbi:MAG: hypothetical protein LBQ27_03185 [Clostridiales bacterium]|jgi:hypothetical protein|nr:hypothetical protein [Clostridiales bacterium]
MFRGRKGARISAIFILLFSLAALAVIVVPSYVTGLPSFIEGYKPLEHFFDFSNYNIDLFLSDWGTVAFLIGAVLLVVSVIDSVFGLITGRIAGRKTLSVTALIMFFGYVAYTIVANGLYVSDVDAIGIGYYIVLGASLVSTVFALSTKA